MNKTTISKLNRRHLVGGAGTVGALAVAAAALPLASTPTEKKTVVAAKPPSDPNDGYQLTDHVKRYYQTTKV